MKIFLSLAFILSLTCSVFAVEAPNTSPVCQSVSAIVAKAEEQHITSVVISGNDVAKLNTVLKQSTNAGLEPSTDKVYFFALPTQQVVIILEARKDCVTYVQAVPVQMAVAILKALEDYKAGKGSI
jgi:hypothetical protein